MWINHTWEKRPWPNAKNSKWQPWKHSNISSGEPWKYSKVAYKHDKGANVMKRYNIKWYIYIYIVMKYIVKEYETYIWDIYIYKIKIKVKIEWGSWPTLG